MERGRGTDPPFLFQPFLSLLFRSTTTNPFLLQTFFLPTPTSFSTFFWETSFPFSNFFLSNPPSNTLLESQNAPPIHTPSPLSKGRNPFSSPLLLPPSSQEWKGRGGQEERKGGRRRWTVEKKGATSLLSLHSPTPLPSSE
ncbi:hypothetical protein IE53DRAFT_239205 [Violaceomyces palustris]|uniref:Uncharacterized protein n=1 Tax=Violaceomyces palustris TaxID=1673888 RepID=A0ACD0P828_9BASI|nr:hypothetical protein IE53DRAFT_239205 [Violaceomyces palustris]